jgi:hypothetical protein
MRINSIDIDIFLTLIVQSSVSTTSRFLIKIIYNDDNGDDDNDDDNDTCDDVDDDDGDNNDSYEKNDDDDNDGNYAKGNSDNDNSNFTRKGSKKITLKNLPSPREALKWVSRGRDTHVFIYKYVYIIMRLVFQDKIHDIYVYKQMYINKCTHIIMIYLAFEKPHSSFHRTYIYLHTYMDIYIYIHIHICLHTYE